jgi:hypothetical protein
VIYKNVTERNTKIKKLYFNVYSKEFRFSLDKYCNHSQAIFSVNSSIILLPIQFCVSTIAINIIPG